MTKILIGQSYFLRFDPKLWQAMQPYPPLGSLYAVAYLRELGYEVALFDAMLAESEAEWTAALKREQPTYAVLYEDSFNYLSKMCLLRMRQAAFTMAESAKAHGCTVIVSGSDATDHLDDYFQHGVDFALIGEGERTLGELIGQLSGRDPKPLATINGLAYYANRFADTFRDSESKPSGLTTVFSSKRTPNNLGEPESRDGSSIHRTEPRAFERELDRLPFPAWDLVDVPRYQKIWRERHGYYSMNMVTTRGCPYRCNWCAKPIYGRRYNSRSPENVVAELKWLKESYQPDHIWFADDIFGLKPGWIERFSELAREQDAVVPFKCLQRVDLISESVAAALRAAQCQIVWVGAESGSQTILDAMDKDTQVEEIYQAVKRLHRQGVKVGFFLQFGYLGEAWADIEQTLQMIRDCQPDDIGISVSYPLPGTKFHEKVKLQLERTNWQDSDDLAMLYQGTFSTDFYRELHKRVHYEYRARRAWSHLKRVASQPHRWRVGHLRQAASIPVNWARLGRSVVKLRAIRG